MTTCKLLEIFQAMWRIIFGQKNFKNLLNNGKLKIEIVPPRKKGHLTPFVNNPKLLSFYLRPVRQTRSVNHYCIVPNGIVIYTPTFVHFILIQ